MEVWIGMDRTRGESDPRRAEVARSVIEQTVVGLPELLRSPAENLPVTFEAWPSEAIAAETGSVDLLGLFIGTPHHCTDDPDPMPPQILLFLESLWDFSNGEEAVFRREVRITYLHELGHFLGLDEDALTDRGLE